MKACIPYALVGVGGFGRQHLTTLTELEQEGDIRLVAVCDPGIRHLPEIEAELRARGVRVYETFHSLMAESSDFKAITIAAPIQHHLSMAKSCLARNLYVYLEKPPVPLLEQWEELMAADRHAKIAVGFQLIESGWNQRLKSEILNGLYGTLREIRVAACWPRDDFYYNRAPWAGQMAVNGNAVFDGPATNALAHLIHQIMFLASAEPDGFNEPVTVRGELYRARPLASYDVSSLKGRFASGVTFSAAFAHASAVKIPYQIKVIGSEGWAKVSEEGEIVRNHLGQIGGPVPGGDPFKDSYFRFLKYVAGVATRPSTLLKDVKGYISTTNGMLLSSGSVHTINPAYVQYLKEEGIYAVMDINRYIETSLETGHLFSETDAPWACATPEVDIRNLGPVEMAGILKHF